ncbi:hypothetical protein GCM10010082_11980 [Kushneria pakistanensis]|uniref:Quercetin 2,3-dioxygenase C-terminal cupin domain-containing protein n=1 Tax=Kushneria pakistanensis TaxID=1508770 RepID=A0ABQ3FFD8_9GAMM|nr:Type 1 glutamine amidotransferase-like domain-containing protein [Kushneria pakistanensis]GHC21785.1 hypothetical protein GCM10010082_11980 [Kushneria pakistanensis]
MPFQINPHFISGKSAGHHGESREERLTEYLVLNPPGRVVALPEGTALRREGARLELLGDQDAWLFTSGTEQGIRAGQRCDALLDADGTAHSL